MQTKVIALLFFVFHFAMMFLQDLLTCCCRLASFILSRTEVNIYQITTYWKGIQFADTTKQERKLTLSAGSYRGNVSASSLDTKRGNCSNGLLAKLLHSSIYLFRTLASSNCDNGIMDRVADKHPQLDVKLHFAEGIVLIPPSPSEH